ncbi:MAG: PIN domain-containing protein [Thaumarchaeota archaeon]|nr:PIN domain-containing protein [Nitrososphaerota archaeon]
MLLESDILFAHIKNSDWLKKTADELLSHVEKGSFGTVYASRETLHEMYYLSAKTGWTSGEALSKIGSLTQIKNLSWPPTTTDVDLLALSLLATYDISSVFDAYHAASCLLYDPDHLIVSTDEVYDKIKHLTRMDPKAAVEKAGRHRTGTPT